jgi:hypothetical protein
VQRAAQRQATQPMRDAIETLQMELHTMWLKPT